MIWTVAGAAAFCATEGPREREQVVLLKNMQKDLAVGLATELRQLRTEQDQDVEPLWSDKVRQYVAKHEKLLLAAVVSGYGEGGNSGQLWTFPGCVLFAISLITTLGTLIRSKLIFLNINENQKGQIVLGREYKCAKFHVNYHKNSKRFNPL